MSQIIFKRKDSSKKSNSYKDIYDLEPLSSIEREYHENILRIIKKSILGSNFYYSYAYPNIKSYITQSLSLISLCFFSAPELLNFLFNVNKGENESKLENYASFVWSIISLIINIILIINDFKKTKSISKYMEFSTQLAIIEENEKMKGKYFCQISNDGNFNVEIKKNSNKNFEIKNKNYFFKYMINLPNINSTSLLIDCLYYEMFSEIDKEMVNLIIYLFDLIEDKNEKKFKKFFRNIKIISMFIPFFNFFWPEKTINNFNLICAFTISLLIAYNIGNYTLTIKRQKRLVINDINKQCYKIGYFINLNDDVISICVLKDEYKFNNNIKKIGDNNERFGRNINLLFD